MAIDQGILLADPQNLFFINDSSVPPHSGNGEWWLSPDVFMVNTPPDESTANPDSNGNVKSQVIVRSNAYNSGPSEVNTVRIDFFVGNPALKMTPLNTFQPPSGASKPIAGFGDANPTTVDWTVSMNASDPNSANPNHKCVVARCYPFLDPSGNTTNPDLFDLSGYLPGDQHYAQHNLDVKAIPPGAQPRIQIQTGNQLEEPQLVVIQAVPDLRPSQTTLAAILPSLQVTRGFKQISNAPLRRVSFDFDPLTEKGGGGFFHKIEDFLEDKVKEVLRELEAKFGHAAPGGTGAQGRVTIGPKFYAAFDFIVDTTGAQPGDAHIYHLTQTTAQGTPDGGLTVAIVVS